MDTIDRAYPLCADALGIPPAPVGVKAGESKTASTDPAVPLSRPSMVIQWFLHDIPFIALLLLAILGVVVRMSDIYWFIMIPVCGVISIAEGWRLFVTRNDVWRSFVLSHWSGVRSCSPSICFSTGACRAS